MRDPRKAHGGAIRFVAVSILFILLISLSLLPAHAAPEASLTGNKVLRPGELLTLTLRVSGNGEVAAQADLHYDTAKLTFVSATSLLDGWSLDELDKPQEQYIRIIASDDKQTKPMSGSRDLFAVSFRVNGSLSAGTSISVSAQNISVAGHESETELPGARYSIELSPPKSGNASLKALAVSGTSLTPDFSPDITEYTAATVPFAVSSLSLTPETAHAGATVKIGGNDLRVGDNTVTITVTAENGTEKVYRIRIEREQDPNYVPSSDSALSAITLSAGMLSPTFAPDLCDYLVTLPYEIGKLTAGGTPRDPLAIGCSDQTLTLTVGENLLTLICRAEDGSETAYRLHILRMPRYEGWMPTVTPGTEPPADTDPPITNPPETPPAQTDPDTGSAPDTSAPVPSVSDTEAPEAPQSTPSDPIPGDPSGQGLSALANRDVLIAIGATGGVMLGLGLIIGALAAKPRVYTYKANKR